MGQNYSFGSAGGGTATAEPATQGGSRRLQIFGVQSIEQTQDGPWVVLFSNGDWQLFAQYEAALYQLTADPDARLGEFHEHKYEEA